MVSVRPSRWPVVASLVLLVASACSAADQPGSSPTTGTSADVPGVTATEIRIGVDDINLVSATVNVAGTSRGPAQQYTDALLADLNAKDGVAGRRVVPVYHTYQVQNYPGFLDQEQAACAHYTEDAKVAVVIGQSFGHSENFLACLARRGVPFLESGFSVHGAPTFRRFPLYFNPSTPPRTELITATVDSLHQREFLPAGSRVGRVLFDDLSTPDMVEALEGALAANGLALTKLVTLPRPQSPADGQASAASAVLQLKDAEVDRVLGAVNIEQLMQRAETQDYHPLYAMDSQAGLGGLPTRVPARQLRGALAVGWVPALDVDAGRDPGSWPARQRCLDIMASAGIKLPDRNAERGALSHCDVVSLLAAGAERSRGALDGESLRRAIEGLGSSFEPASTFATRFGPDRHAGAAVIRTLAFHEGCTCFSYTSGDVPLG